MGRRDYFEVDVQDDNLQITLEEREQILLTGSSEDDVINPPYKIANAAGGLSDYTVHTDVRHYNGLLQYDTHNLYGHSMSSP